MQKIQIFICLNKDSIQYFLCMKRNQYLMLHMIMVLFHEILYFFMVNAWNGWFRWWWLQKDKKLEILNSENSNRNCADVVYHLKILFSVSRKTSRWLIWVFYRIFLMKLKLSNNCYWRTASNGSDKNNVLVQYMVRFSLQVRKNLIRMNRV